MLTRRGFIITSGSALGALSLASAAGASVLGGASDVLTIASVNRPLSAAAQGAGHISLTGDLVQDFATIEKAFSSASAPELRVSLDAADEVLLDIAMTRVSSNYVAAGAENGARVFRRNSSFVGA